MRTCSAHVFLSSPVVSLKQEEGGLVCSGITKTARSFRCNSHHQAQHIVILLGDVLCLGISSACSDSGLWIMGGSTTRGERITCAVSFAVLVIPSYLILFSFFSCQTHYFCQSSLWNIKKKHCHVPLSSCLLCVCMHQERVCCVQGLLNVTQLNQSTLATWCWQAAFMHSTCLSLVQNRCRFPWKILFWTPWKKSLVILFYFL